MVSDVFIVPRNNDGIPTDAKRIAGDIHEFDNCLDLGTRGTTHDILRLIKFIVSIGARFRLMLLIINNRHKHARPVNRDVRSDSI